MDVDFDHAVGSGATFSTLMRGSCGGVYPSITTGHLQHGRRSARSRRSTRCNLGVRAIGGMKIMQLPVSRLDAEVFAVRTSHGADCPTSGFISAADARHSRRGAHAEVSPRDPSPKSPKSPETAAAVERLPRDAITGFGRMGLEPSRTFRIHHLPPCRGSGSYAFTGLKRIAVNGAVFLGQGRRAAIRSAAAAPSANRRASGTYAP